LLDLDALDQGPWLPRRRAVSQLSRAGALERLMKDSLDGRNSRRPHPKWQRIMALRSLSESMGRSLLDIALQFCRGTPAVGRNSAWYAVENHLSENLRYFQAVL